MFAQYQICPKLILKFEFSCFCSSCGWWINLKDLILLDSDSDDRIDEPRRPVFVVTRPSAKARLGWNSPERTTRDNVISKNKHRVVPEFATRLGRDKDSNERESSKDQDRITGRYEKRTSMQHSRTSPPSRPNKNSVKSPDVVRKRKSISSSESESEISSDQERIPSPLIPVSNRGRRLPDSRQNKTVTTDARLLITTKSSRVRRVEETCDEVVPAKRSVASTDYKKSPVRLVAMALPTRRIFIAEGSKTNGKLLFKTNICIYTGLYIFSYFRFVWQTWDWIFSFINFVTSFNVLTIFYWGNVSFCFWFSPFFLVTTIKTSRGRLLGFYSSFFRTTLYVNCDKTDN